MEGQVTDDVEVVVRDDSPNDATGELVKEFEKKFPIRYFHGQKGGIDPAMIFVTEEARGEYVWWMGDDEFKPGAIAEVIAVLRAHPQITFCYANFIQSGSHEPNRTLGGSRFFHSRNEALELLAGNLGFISATIFKREIALTGVELSRKFIGTAFVNLYLALTALGAAHGNAYFIEGPLLVNYPTPPEKVNDNGSPKYLASIFITSSWSSAARSTAQRCAACFGKEFRVRVARGVLVRWMTGYSESPKGKRWPMLKTYWSYPSCWLAIVLFCLPRQVNKGLYKTYKVFFAYRRFKFLSR